jgi:primosomal protein N'
MFLGGATEDVRRQERLVIGFRRLASRVGEAQGTLLLQTPPQDDETHSESIYASWLTPQGFATYRARELAERSLFKYPPTVRLVKCIIEGTLEQAEVWLQQAERLVSASWRGPYPIDFRVKSRTSRFIAHAVFPAHTTESAIVNAMRPLKGHAWIDLDPLAFFK